MILILYALNSYNRFIGGVMKSNLLIVEDNKEIAEIIKLHLESSNYCVEVAYDGLEGLNICKDKNFDLVIVDIMMDGLDGYSLIKNLRLFSELPIMIVSAKNEDSDKILGLNIGADDYITKPFNPMEIVARVNALLRRSAVNNKNSYILQFAELKIDCLELKVFKNNIEIDLTATEFKILKLFIANPNRIFSKKMIGKHLNQIFFDSDENSITVHISHIREKIGKNSNGNQYIKTIRGLGYRIENV